MVVGIVVVVEKEEEEGDNGDDGDGDDDLHVLVGLAAALHVIVPKHRAERKENNTCFSRKKTKAD